MPLNTSYTVKPLYIEKYAITSPIEVSANNNVEETHTISYNQDKWSVIFKEHIEASNHIFDWKPNDAGANLVWKYTYNGTEYSGTTTFAFTGATINNKQSYFYPKDAVIAFTINSVSGYSSTNLVEEQTVNSIKETVNTIQYKENSYFSIYIDASVSGPDAMITEGMDYNGTLMKEFLSKIRRCVIENVTSATTEEGTIPMANIRFLDNTNGTLYATGTSAPITAKDVMVFFPEHWYLGIQDTSNTNKWECRFSNVEQKGYKFSPAFLLGVYKASSVTGDGSGSYGNSGTTQIYSVSGGYRVTGVSNTNFKAKAAARGDGFQIIDYEMHKTIANLFYLKYKNTNAQAKCGAGPHIWSERTNGSTDALGMTDTTADASSAGPINNSNTGATFVNFLGLEGAWGYVYENVEGLEIEDRYLKFVFQTTGTDTTTYISVKKLVDIYVAGNGINITSNTVSVKIDASGEAFLTVGTGGLKLSGVQTAINTAVTTEKNRAEGIENSLRTDVDSKVSGITASDTSITVDNTTTTNPKLKVTLSQTDGNRLALNADGLYVTNTIDCGTF